MALLSLGYCCATTLHEQTPYKMTDHAQESTEASLSLGKLQERLNLWYMKHKSEQGLKRDVSGLWVADIKFL
jgi:hypothetical protein